MAAWVHTLLTCIIEKGRSTKRPTPPILERERRSCKERTSALATTTAIGTKTTPTKTTRATSIKAGVREDSDVAEAGPEASALKEAEAEIEAPEMGIEAPEVGIEAPEVHEVRRGAEAGEEVGSSTTARIGMIVPLMMSIITKIMKIDTTNTEKTINTKIEKLLAREEAEDGLSIIERLERKIMSTG